MIQCYKCVSMFDMKMFAFTTFKCAIIFWQPTFKSLQMWKKSIMQNRYLADYKKTQSTSCNQATAVGVILERHRFEL